MKSSYIFVIVIFVSAALGIGWFFENRTPQLITNTLEVPDNIDYYLSNFKYQSMNQQGSPHYILKSPYLEHYIQQDISHLQQPTMQFFGDKFEWLIKSGTGKLQHKEEQFELQQQVELSRKSTLLPMTLHTELMILKAQRNLIEIPQDLSLVTNNLNLRASSAALDIQQNRYQFTRVNATYKPDNIYRDINEQS